jgi:hypothetical protein
MEQVKILARARSYHGFVYEGWVRQHDLGLLGAPRKTYLLRLSISIHAHLVRPTCFAEEGQEEGKEGGEEGK